MVFAGLPFLVVFFPVVCLLYTLVPMRYKNLLLLLASLFFYAWGDIKYLPLLFVVSLEHYIFGILINKQKNSKALLIIGVIIDVSILAYYKYIGFIFEQLGLGAVFNDIRLPLGISFFTFQSMSYLVDVYRGNIKAESNLINYLTYILMFPQLVAGPIVRYSDIQHELHERSINYTKLEKGVLQFVVGLSAKVLLANNFALLLAQANNYNTSLASFISMFSIGMQYYFDFAGYSLMAIGMGNIFGFSFPINFDQPYSAYSATTFWRKWHITLGSWFREYVYIPLGGNRVGKLRFIFNVMLVWFLTGFWHGASWNFIVWGVYYGVIIILEKFFINKHLKEGHLVSHIYGLLVIFIGWYFVGYDDVGLAFSKIITLFSFNFAKSDLYLIQNAIVLMIISIALCIPNIIHSFENLLYNNLYLRLAFSLSLLLLSIAALVSSGYNPFLYFRF